MGINGQPKRIDYLDIAKGLGMLLVIYAHILREGPVNWYIYIFHMPLFFFISGMLFVPAKYEKCSALIKKRFHTLIIPYIIYSVVTWFVWVGYSVAFHQRPESYWMPLLQTVFAQGSGGFLLHNVPLWFITCLFVVDIGYFYLNKIKSRAVLIITCMIISGLGYCMIEVFEFFPFKLLPWNIEVAFAVMIYYAVGNVFAQGINQNLDSINHKNIALFLLIAVLLTAAVIYASGITRHISYGSNNLGDHPIVDYIGAFIGIFLTLLISHRLSLVRTGSSLITKAIYYIKWIGRYSLRFLAFHCPIKGVFCVIVAKGFHTSVKVVEGSLFYSSIVFVITLVITSLITLAICKYYDKPKSARKTAEAGS